LVRRLQAACTPYLTFPEAGPARDELAAGLRVALDGNYAIYEWHTDSEPVIGRVLHGARDVAAMAALGAFFRG
jgi:toxin ParE1/3/4